jgi:hypothetical protein
MDAENSNIRIFDNGADALLLYNAIINHQSECIFENNIKVTIDWKTENIPKEYLDDMILRIVNRAQMHNIQCELNSDINITIRADEKWYILDAGFCISSREHLTLQAKNLINRLNIPITAEVIRTNQENK